MTDSPERDQQDVEHMRRKLTDVPCPPMPDEVKRLWPLDHPFALQPDPFADRHIGGHADPFAEFPGPDPLKEDGLDWNRDQHGLTVRGRLVKPQRRSISFWEWGLIAFTLFIITLMILTAVALILWPGKANAETGSVGGPSDDGSVTMMTLNDYAFLQSLDEEGISHNTDAETIEAGYTICDMIVGADGDFLAVIEKVYQNSKLEESDAAYFVGVATSAYCPEYMPAEITGVTPQQPQVPVRGPLKRAA